MSNEKVNLLEYWTNPFDLPNKPEEYAKYTKRSDFLFRFIGNHIKKEDRILEIGCNIGRNLNKLYENGYHNLYGVDISSNALQLMGKIYPNLKATTYNEDIESFLKRNSEKFDVVFTMAVFEHIENEKIFKYVSDLSNRIIITIEDEASANWKMFPRNYSNIFSNLGWKQLVFKKASIEDELTDKYIGRIFERGNQNAY